MQHFPSNTLIWTTLLLGAPEYITIVTTSTTTFQSIDEKWLLQKEFQQENQPPVRKVKMDINMSGDDVKKFEDNGPNFRIQIAISYMITYIFSSSLENKFNDII